MSYFNTYLWIKCILTNLVKLMETPGDKSRKPCLFQSSNCRALYGFLLRTDISKSNLRVNPSHLFQIFRLFLLKKKTDLLECK